MSAPWKRISPSMPPVGQIQAVQAKKHVTIFSRSPSAPGAGRPEVKAGFTACAKATGGIPGRLDRNISLKNCMVTKGLKTGIYRRKSRSKYAPLAGTVYEKKAVAA